MKIILLWISLSMYCCLLKAQSTPEEKLVQTLHAITDLYVDSIPKEIFVNSTIAKMMQKLDPYSEYLSPEQMQRNEEVLGGMTFSVGIGMEGTWIGNCFYVSFVEKEGNAWKQGIRAGDEILSVDGKAVDQLQGSLIFRSLKGEEGSGVTLKIKRREQPVFERRVIRTHIPRSSVRAAYMMDSKTGYISISMFSKNTLDDFRRSLLSLLQQGMKDLVLDIQKNEGGLFDEAVAVADEFLAGKEPIVYAEGVHMKRKTFFAGIKGSFEQGRLVVLVSEQTKSAAEILAGALQDRRRAVLVGNHTFGKGLIQDTFSFKDGSALRLTVARYFTPNGRSIQGKGVIPDVLVHNDTVYFTKWYNLLVYCGVQKKVTRDYVMEHRLELLKKYRNIGLFLKSFMPDSLLQSVCQVSKEANIVFSEEEYEKSKSFLLVQLKALVARELFNENQYYYQILNSANSSVQKAYEIVKSLDDYQMILKGSLK